MKLTDAAKYYKEEKHQIEAWDWLQSQLTDKQLEIFATKYRAKKSDDKFRPSDSFDHRITPHITYGEVCMNQGARRFKYQYQCDVALEICQYLEEVRTQFGNKPLIITSGHRPYEVNKSVGGAVNSEHLYNDATTGAIDFYIDGVDTFALQNYCAKTWPYSVGLGAQKGFVHIGIRKDRPRVRWNY